MMQNFAAGAEFREICDCRDRREKFTALVMMYHTLFLRYFSEITGQIFAADGLRAPV